MKKIYLSLCIVASLKCFGQNTFPASGNVGIGTNAATAPLHIVGSVGNTILLEKSSNNFPAIAWKGANYISLIEGGDALSFSTNGMVRVNVSPNGNVGIGTVVPSSYYHGGNNRVLEILNPNTETNSQSHIILSTGATTNFGGVGSVSFMAANAANSKGVAYIAATLTSDASVNATGDLVFATANASGPFEKMRIDHNGNVGIGTTTPAGKLSFQDIVIGSEPVGITWYSGGNNPTSYGIHRTAGAWNAPDYQQLRLGFETGIVIDPGTAYGKSYLDVQGNGIRVTSGSVGIGTTTPTRKLEVIADAGVGPLRVAGANGSLLIDNVGTGENYYAASVAHYFQDNSSNIRMAILGNGNVGIGVAAPTEKLSVNGNIHSKKVIVTQTGWPDYVFDSSYQLPSLDSVSTFIQANKHLPDMPSAATVEKDGHDLGEVQKLLLKKMEELTLYIIEMKKENAEKYEALRKENEALKVKIETIQSKK